MRREVVDHALLVATNEGGFYSRFCKYAMHERKGGLPISGPDTVAKLWVSGVVQLGPTLRNNAGIELTTREVLALALELSQHYAQHLEDWTHSDRLDFCKQHGIM
jgi:hypothetical protein